jgi:hypothetical protein
VINTENLLFIPVRLKCLLQLSRTAQVLSEGLLDLSNSELAKIQALHSNYGHTMIRAIPLFG